MGQAQAAPIYRVVYCNHCDKVWRNDSLMEIHYLVDHPESYEAGIYMQDKRPLRVPRNW